MGRLIDADALLEKLKGTPRYFDVKFDIEEMPTAYDVEKAEKERKALQNRCRIFTNGVICRNCPMDCEERTMPFFGKKVE